MGKCWRCKGRLVVYLNAGKVAPCPACFHVNRYEFQAAALLKCAPRSRYRLGDNGGTPSGRLSQ